MMPQNKIQIKGSVPDKSSFSDILLELPAGKQDQSPGIGKTSPSNAMKTNEPENQPGSANTYQTKTSFSSKIKSLKVSTEQ